MNRRHVVKFGVAALGIATCLSSGAGAQRAAAAAATGEWRTYGGDLRSTRYSALDQINKDNFSTLEVAWRFKTDALGPRPEFNFQSTPLMVGGVLYTTGGTRRAVVALEFSRKRIAHDRLLQRLFQRLESLARENAAA